VPPVPPAGLKIDLKPGDVVPPGVRVTVEVTPAGPAPVVPPKPPVQVKEGPAAEPKLPTDDERYAAAVAVVREIGGNVVLAVGVPLPPLYVNAKEAFPSGYRSIPDGVYDCLMLDGVPHMQRVPDPVVMPQRVQAAPAHSVYAPNVFPGVRIQGAGGCANGQCAAPRRR